MAQDIFKYEKRYWYPHLKPRDIEIWERFIAKYPDAYLECQYDFAVGDIPQFMKERSSLEGQAMQELYRLKIDVLGHNLAGIDLIELKPEAGISSFGQVLGYKTLYEVENRPGKPVRPVIITNELRPNMESLAKQNGVMLYIV